MISDLSAQFIKEKRYLNNLSERTLSSYQTDVFKRWMRYVGKMPTQQNISQLVIGMREQGLASHHLQYHHSLVQFILVMAPSKEAFPATSKAPAAQARTAHHENFHSGPDALATYLEA